MLALHIINSIKYYYLYCKNATELQHNFEAEVELNNRDAHARVSEKIVIIIRYREKKPLDNMQQEIKMIMLTKMIPRKIEKIIIHIQNEIK